MVENTSPVADNLTYVAAVHDYSTSARLCESKRF
jgi:hypothetical protein